MGGGQQNLRSVITIGGNTDASFGTLSDTLSKFGNTLLNMGNYIDPISQKLIGFGKESVTNYASYEDVLLKIKSTGEMTDKQMGAIEEATRQAGLTSRYTASDAAEAALLLTQVGLGYKDVIDLLPDVLQMAQAGDLSIATSSEYLYSSLMSMGKPLEYANTLIDQMAKASSVSAMDMDTLGETMRRLGSSVDLIQGGSSEVLTIMAGMSKYGKDMQGTMGGTALRNFFLRLAAPAKGAKAVIEELGVSAEELDEIMEGANADELAIAMQNLGLQVYNEKHELNDGIDIIRSLRDSVAGLDKDDMRAKLKTVFGDRTITTAMNLIKLTDEEWNKLQADIENSDGYAKYMAEVQEGGLGGAIRILQSQFEELGHTVGKSLEVPVKAAAESIGQIITWLTSLDETTRDNIVIAMGAIAGAGPALLGVGAGLKLLAFASTPGGAIALATIGLVGLVAIIQNLEEASISESFGSMEMDMERLRPHIEGLSSEFSRSVSGLGEYSEGIDKALESYQTASSTFSNDLLTAAITGMVLTDADKTNLADLGGQMLDATVEGINLKQQENSAFLDALFKGTGEDEAKQNILDTQNAYFQGLFADAQSIGQTLRDQMTEALRDGSLDANENEAIMQTVGRLNAINAQIADMQNRQEYEKLLHKGQSTSLDSLREFADTVTAQRDAELAAAQETYLDSYAWTKIGYDDRIATASTPDERDALIKERLESLDAMDRAMESREVETASKYAGLIAQAWESALKNSDYGDMYQDVLGFSQEALANNGDGVISLGDWAKNNNGRQLAELVGLLKEGKGSFGGYGELSGLVDMYAKSGEEAPQWLSTTQEMLNAYETAYAMVYNKRMDAFGGQGFSIDNVWYEQMVAANEAMQQLQQPITNEENSWVGRPGSGFDESIEQYAQGQGLSYGDAFAQSMLQTLGLVSEAGEVLGEAASDGMLENVALMRNALDEYQQTGSVAAETTREIQSLLTSQGFDLSKFGVDGLFGSETTGAIQRFLAEFDSQSIIPDVSLDAPAIAAQAPPVQVEPVGVGQSVDVGVNADATPVASAIQSLDGTDVVVDLSTDTKPVSSKILSMNGTDVTVDLVADDSGLVAYLSNKTYRGKVSLSTGGMDAYAEGGRTTEAAIFGEVPGQPEWAIPEKHDERTAELLRSAAAASGFTWNELLGSTGGLNANPSRPKITLVYSPVIHAKDATDVEEKLIQDKERLDEWFADKMQAEERMQY